MTLPQSRPLHFPRDWPPTLLVVVDTEEEFDWAAPFDRASTAVTNIAEQHRGQAVWDAHGVAPSYVVDYPVATSAQACAILGGFARDGRCSIGAHLHPWVTPPHEEVVSNRHSFAGNLPPALEAAKLGALTAAIAAGFGRRPVVYKAGRYGVGPATAGILQSLGYAIDCSVVPFTDFSGVEGPDFSRLADVPFEIAPGLVELPLSVGFAGLLAGAGARLFPALHAPLARRLRLNGIAARGGLLERLRLSPEGHGLADMIRQTEAAMRRGQRLFMLTYHSSSLLPGAAPYVRSEADRTDFIARLDGYCRYFMARLGGRPGRLEDVAARLTAA